MLFLRFEPTAGRRRRTNCPMTSTRHGKVVNLPQIFAYHGLFYFIFLVCFTNQLEIVSTKFRKCFTTIKMRCFRIRLASCIHRIKLFSDQIAYPNAKTLHFCYRVNEP